MRDETFTRCFGSGEALYENYHDHEWGVPVHDERELFERLCLEAFQCGLSWGLVLRRREGMSDALAGFDAETLARFGPPDVERLLHDDRMLKNRLKIEAVIHNAQVLLDLHEGGDSLEQVMWSHRPVTHARPASFADMPSQTLESQALTADLKRLGFKFVGPVTMYATMQAIGIVNDHLVGCPAGDVIEQKGAAS